MAKTPNIQHVAELIRNLVPKEDPQPKDHSAYVRVFSQFDQGSLFLDRADSYAYSETLKRLVEQFGKSEALSTRAIEQALQRAIFSAIDIPKKRQRRPLEERIQNAMAELLHDLRQPAMTYHCYVPVGGVELKGLPYRFGPVTFLAFNMHQLRKFHKTVQLQSVSDNEKKLRNHLLKHLKRSSIWNFPCAITEVRAQDSNAALVLARDRVRIAIELINFFSDYIPYNSGWLYFPEEAVRASLVSPSLREDRSFFLPFQTKGPVMKFSFQKLREARQLIPFMRKLDGALMRNPRREIDELFISAVQWAGRATVELRREEAFLFSAVALESLVLPEGDPRELSYRLRIRTAHLLGDSVKEREEIGREVNDLYVIRSKIVHKGYRQVTDAEWSRIKALVTQVIFRILRSRTVAKLSSRKEFAQWFEGKVLS